MASLVIPENGVSLGSAPGNYSKAGSSGLPAAYGISLSDTLIEDMIKCVQNGESIQLSLGAQPVSFQSRPDPSSELLAGVSSELHLHPKRRLLQLDGLANYCRHARTSPMDPKPNISLHRPTLSPTSSSKVPSPITTTTILPTQKRWSYSINTEEHFAVHSIDLR
jgi:hypothetical protein